MSDEIVSTPSNSADPQGDLLSRFLSDDTPSTAQAQVKQAGGVPVESQPSVSEPVKSNTEPVSAAPVAPVKTKEVSPDNMAVPKDILKKQKIEIEEDTIPAQPQQDDQEVIPQEVSQRGKKGVDAWTLAKREAKQYKQKVEELERKLAEIETTSQSSKELEELKARYEESEKNRQAIEDRLGQVDIAYSATFKDTYDKPISNTFSKSVKLLMQAGVDQKTAKDIVVKSMAVNNTPDSIQEIVQDFPPAIQGALYQNAVEMIEGQKRRAQAIKEWRSTKAAMKEEERRATEVKMSEVISQNVESAIESVRNEGSWLYTQSETDDNWNEQVKERIDAVHGLMKTATPDVLAKYVADGIVSKTYRQLYEKQLALNSKLKKELEGRVRSRPSIGGGAFLSDDDSASRGKPVKADDWLDMNLRK